jgi:hypothetical protein
MCEQGSLEVRLTQLNLPAGPTESVITARYREIDPCRCPGLLRNAVEDRLQRQRVALRAQFLVFAHAHNCGHSWRIVTFPGPRKRDGRFTNLLVSPE